MVFCVPKPNQTSTIHPHKTSLFMETDFILDCDKRPEENRVWRLQMLKHSCMLRLDAEGFLQLSSKQAATDSICIWWVAVHRHPVLGFIDQLVGRRSGSSSLSAPHIGPECVDDKHLTTLITSIISTILIYIDRNIPNRWSWTCWLLVVLGGTSPRPTPTQEVAAVLWLQPKPRLMAKL